MKSNIETYKFAKQFIGNGGAIFRSYCGLGKRDPYCNAYVTYILHKTDNASLYCDGKKQTYCPMSIKWCYNNLANIPPYLALPMDIVYFDWELNGIPNHIGFAKERKSDQVLLTHEGNTSGGIVAEKSRNTKYIQAVFRLHYPVTFDISKPLTVDGYFGYNSIAMLQKVLGLKPDGILGKQTVKALQKIAGVSQDGSWGKKTSKAVQKMVKTDVDGAFGPKSVKALQAWINKMANFPGEKVEKKPEPPKVVTPSPAPVKVETPPNLPSLDLKKTTSEVISDTITWAKWIASDNNFHYGHGKAAHHNGCYFCGTNTLKGKRAKTGVNDYKKSYCCNPFVGAAWAHGGCDQTALNLCKKGSSWDYHKNAGYAKSPRFKNLGHPKKADLKPGDVLCRDTHVALYIGNGKIVHAGHEDDNKRFSASWNSSIAEVELTDKNYANFPRVHRYTGSVDVKDFPLRYGEVSARVKLWQKFLNSYNGKQVVAVDGIFGDATLKYTKAFQTAKKITVDGIVGAGTLAKAK